MRPGLLPRLQPRTRRSGPQGSHHAVDSQARRRYRRRHRADEPASSTPAPGPGGGRQLREVAEAAKLLENIFRAVNIALVNELKTLFTAMDIDVWEVIDAAATKPFGFSRSIPVRASAATASPSIRST